MWFKYKRKIPKQAKTTQKVINIHSLVLQHFVRYQLNLRIVVLGLSLSDAEPPKDMIQRILRRYSEVLAPDAAEGADGFAEVFREEVGGDAGAHSVKDGIQ